MIHLEENTAQIVAAIIAGIIVQIGCYLEHRRQ